MKSKDQQAHILMLIMHKKLLLILGLHFRGEIILTMLFEQNYQTGTPLNLNILHTSAEGNFVIAHKTSLHYFHGKFLGLKFMHW